MSPTVEIYIQRKLLYPQWTGCCIFALFHSEINKIWGCFSTQPAKLDTSVSSNRKIHFKRNLQGLQTVETCWTAMNKKAQCLLLLRVEASSLAWHFIIWSVSKGLRSLDHAWKQSLYSVKKHLFSRVDSLYFPSIFLFSLNILLNKRLDRNTSCSKVTTLYPKMLPFCSGSGTGPQVTRIRVELMASAVTFSGAPEGTVQRNSQTHGNQSPSSILQTKSMEATLCKTNRWIFHKSQVCCTYMLFENEKLLLKKYVYTLLQRT